MGIIKPIEFFVLILQVVLNSAVQWPVPLCALEANSGAEIAGVMCFRYSHNYCRYLPKTRFIKRL